MIRFLLTLMCYSFGLVVSALDLEKTDVDRLANLYIEQEKYDSTSLILISFANQEHKKGNLEMALDYQLRNCTLIEQHTKAFIDYGITLKDLYNNYGMVFILQRDLNRTEDAINSYLDLSRIIKRYSPDELPFYTNLIASTLGKCTTKPLADSIYCIQDALDIIKQQKVSKDNIIKYVWFCRCFNMNRMYNSFDNHTFVHNRIDEIESWYKHNRTYINELDSNIYRKEILEYEFDYADLLYLFAGAVGAQKHDLLSAIDLYNKEISVLSSIWIVDNMIKLKIASCYARIADCYYQLGDVPLCKQFCDKAYPLIFNQTDNIEYCDVLSALANIYYNTNQSKIAAKLKLREIGIREKIEGSVSMTDWSQYFLYIINSNPNEIMLQCKKNRIIREPKGGCADYYMLLGKAYSRLMNTDNKYQDLAEMYFQKVDSILLANNDYYEKYDIKNLVLGNLYETWADHYSLLGQYEKSYEYSKKSLDFIPEKYQSYYKVALKSSLLHDTVAIHKFLPYYYYGLEEKLRNMLPILGSVESDAYLGNGEATIYHIPEWASWNPTDSVSVCVAYDAALLMKGLTLRYNILSPYFDSHPEIEKAKYELDRMRDSIYAISDENARLIALHRYELKEREILLEVNKEVTNTHWKDVQKLLKDDEACVEFVKYTANAYSWSVGIPQPHYSAIVLLSNCSSPIFVDLFDEEELFTIYNLQPKSYDNEIGQKLYSKIWGKLQQYIEEKKLVFFSPMGLLNLINIELLTDENGIIAAKKFNLHRVSSTRNITIGKTNKTNKVVSFGGIDYAKATKHVNVLDSLNTRGNWMFLQNTLSEVNDIKELLNGRGIDVTTYTGANATEHEFKQLNGTVSDIIHIASHGYYIPLTKRLNIPYFSNSTNTKNYLDELFYSGLILSGGQKAWAESIFIPENDDGILSAYEISKLDFHNVQLVVLSACETGLGDNLFDGIYGLQRAFKKAGVKSILMSLWQIDDKATADYMNHFYGNLSDGLSTYDAYISTITTMKEKYYDPYYWASFILLD